MVWSREKGTWLLTDHVEQSPPAPPFLHPSLIPSPSAPRSALPSLLHPNMLTHHSRMDVLRPQCDQRTRPSMSTWVSGEVTGQLASSHWVTVKKKKKAEAHSKERKRGVGGEEREQEEHVEKQNEAHCSPEFHPCYVSSVAPPLLWVCELSCTYATNVANIALTGLYSFLR